MAEDEANLHDEIGIHNDIAPQEEINYNVEYDVKEDHTKKHSLLLDLDSTTQKKNFKPTSEQNRKASLQSTESVEVYIYRRTSLVTSSGRSVIQSQKIDDNDINSSQHHQHVETGLNLWDSNSSNKIQNYPNDIQPTNIETQIDNNNISIVQNKSRHSLSVDEQYDNSNINTRIITRKSSTVSGPTSVIYHESDSENINNMYIVDDIVEKTRTKPVRSSSVIFYDGSQNENKLIKASQINESQINESINSIEYKSKIEDINENKHINKSSILEMIGPIVNDINRIKPINDLDEQFYKQIEQERISQKSNEINIKNKQKHKHKYINDMDIKEDSITQELTSDNLMKLNYENQLSDINNINLTNSKENDKRRYISMTDNYKYNKTYYNKKEHIKIHMEPIKENNNNYKLSTKIKYVTAIGAVCAVTVLIGFVMYSKSGNNNNISATKAANMLMTPTNIRRAPPRIG